MNKNPNDEYTELDLDTVVYANESDQTKAKRLPRNKKDKEPKSANPQPISPKLIHELPLPSEGGGFVIDAKSKSVNAIPLAKPFLPHSPDSDDSLAPIPDLVDPETAAKSVPEDQADNLKASPAGIPRPSSPAQPTLAQASNLQQSADVRAGLPKPPAPTLAPTQSQAILADVANNQFAKSTPVAPPQINESSVSSLQQPLPAPTGVSAQDSPVPTLQASPIDQPIPSLQLSSVPQDQTPLPAPTGVSAQDSPVPTLQASPIDQPIPSLQLSSVPQDQTPLPPMADALPSLPPVVQSSSLLPTQTNESVVSLPDSQIRQTNDNIQSLPSVHQAVSPPVANPAQVFNPPLTTPLPIPTTESPSVPEIEDSALPKAAEEGGIAHVRGVKHLKIFGVVTLLIIFSACILTGILIWPKLQAAINSKRSTEVHEFQDVLVNLLQVENQSIKVKVSDMQVENIAPSLAGEDKVDQGQVIVNSALKLKYATDFSDPQLEAKYRFDLDLKNSENQQRQNIVLDVVTTFQDNGRAYFKFENLSINDNAVDLSETEFANRWTDLQDLLQSRVINDNAVLTEIESVFLGYIANLLHLYSYPHYITLLPTFNITEAKDYKDVKTLVLESSAYDFEANSCQTLQDAQLQCRVHINYDALYDLYDDIYDVLEVELPEYYEILKSSSSATSNLPTTIELTFDKDRDYPVKINVPTDDNKITATHLLISYEGFDDNSLKLIKATQPLDLIEYHRLISNYEKVKFGN